MTDKRLAELYAIESFDWIVEDPADTECTIADTHAAHAAEIEALRAEIAGELPVDRVSFLLIGGEPWALTELRRWSGCGLGRL